MLLLNVQSMTSCGRLTRQFSIANRWFCMVHSQQKGVIASSTVSSLFSMENFILSFLMTISFTTFYTHAFGQKNCLVFQPLIPRHLHGTDEDDSSLARSLLFRSRLCVDNKDKFFSAFFSSASGSNVQGTLNAQQIYFVFLSRLETKDSNNVHWIALDEIFSNRSFISFDRNPAVDRNDERIVS